MTVTCKLQYSAANRYTGEQASATAAAAAADHVHAQVQPPGSRPATRSGVPSIVLRHPRYTRLISVQGGNHSRAYLFASLSIWSLITSPLSLNRPAGSGGGYVCTLSTTHAQNNIAGRFIPSLILGFRDKCTGICAGAMPLRHAGFSCLYLHLGIPSITSPESTIIAWLPSGTQPHVNLKHSTADRIIIPYQGTTLSVPGS